MHSRPQAAVQTGSRKQSAVQISSSQYELPDQNPTFLACTPLTPNLPLWTAHHGYSILAESLTSLRWGIPTHTHTDSLHPSPLPCTFVLRSQLCLFQASPS